MGYGIEAEVKKIHPDPTASWCGTPGLRLSGSRVTPLSLRCYCLRGEICKSSIVRQDLGLRFVQISIQWFNLRIAFI